MNNKLYEKIISERDVNTLLELDNDKKENFLIYLMYNRLCNIPFEEMNHSQRTLYLAMKLEDACQADSLTSLAEEKDVFLALSEMKSAFEELGAVKTADLLGELILIVPENTVPEWSWFDENADLIERLDGDISDYPDGLMKNFYLKYISEKDIAEEVLK